MPIKSSKLSQSKLRNLLRSRKLIIFIVAVLAAPLFACLPAGRVLAVNDVQVTGNSNFELNTFDTSVLTTIVASSGGQVTNFDVQSNYIDITLDNSSTVTFTTTVGGQYLKIIHQSGSSNYTVTPSCPTTTVTLIGTGATAILRLEVLTTNTCGGGGGGGGGTSPINGACGIANNRSSYSIPTINLCNYGTPSAVTGSGPWTWICNGLYGGSNSSICTANKASNFSAGCTSTSGYSATTGLSCSGTIPTSTPTPSVCTPTTTVCTPYMTKYIKLGAANDSNEVKKLQIFLRDYEGFSTLSVTGIYDDVTFDAVEQFQSKYAQDVLIPWGFTAPTGYVYTTTEKKINEIYCQVTATAASPSVCTPTTTVCTPYMTKYIKLGAANDSNEVKKLQIFLRDYEGFSTLSVTGIYDQATFNAVKVFQSKYAQDVLIPWGFTTPTGYVYTTTEKKINKIYCSKTPVTPTPITPTPTPATANSFTQPLSLGSNGPQVILLQDTLKKLGFFPQAVASNGNFGPTTLKAVQDFQVYYNIAKPGDFGYGQVGPNTRRVLNQLINR